MKTLTVFYSRTGNNKKMAGYLNKSLGGDLEEIVDLQKRDGLWGYFISGLQASLKMKTRIKEPLLNPLKYDLVIVVAPLWVSVVPPAIRTYLALFDNKIKSAALLSVCGSGQINIRAKPDMESLIGKKLKASLFLKEGEFKRNKYQKKLEKFIKAIV